MTISDTFKEQAEVNYSDFCKTLKKIKNQDFKDAILGADFNEQQQESIKKSFSTGSDCDRFDETKSFEDISFEDTLAHAFMDSIRKTTSILLNIQFDIHTDDDLLKILTIYQNVAENVIHNATILGLSKKDTNTGDVLIDFKDKVLNPINNVLNELEERSNLDRKNVEIQYHGIETMDRLLEI